MTEVISVRFRGGCKNYYFNPNGNQVKMGDQVIVETAQGPEFATCTEGNHEVEDSAIVKPLSPMLRMATDSDRRTVEQNKKRESEAFDICEKKIAAHGLEEILAESTQPVNSFEYGYECANQLLRDEPELDAILAPVDLQGLGVLRALKEQGIRVPEQVKVISMTGHAIGEMLETSMTSMEMPAFEMGEKAAQLTIMEIERPSEKAPTPQSIQFPYTLTQRETT